MTDSKAYNMKTIVLKPVLALLTACAVFSACSNDKQDVYNNADNGITYLPLPEEMHIHPLGDVINVSYTSDEDWKVRFSDSYQDWVSMTGSGRAGTSKLSISVSPNVQSDNDRNLTISFCSTDGKVVYDEFTIFQNVAVLEVNQKSFDDLGWKKPEDNKAFIVTSNIQWRMTLNDPASNFAENTKKVGKICGTLDTEFERSEEDVKFTPVENNISSENRTAEFIITPVKLDKDGNEVQLTDTDLEKLTDTVSVSQNYLLFYLNDNKNSIPLDGFSELGKDYVEAHPDSINPEEHVCEKTFSITSEVKVKYDEDALKKIGGELVEGNHTEVERPDGRTEITTVYTLSMTKPNPTTDEDGLNYALKFWAEDDQNAFRTVNVKQKPYVFDLKFEGELSYSNQGGENEIKTLTVNTTGPWELDTAEEEKWQKWLSINQTSGVGTTQLTVKSIVRNLEFSDLVQELQFSSELHGGNTEFASIEKTVTARQERFQFDVTPDNELNASLSRANTNTHSISVTSSGEWAYKLKYNDGYKDWLKTDIQVDKLIVTPSKNDEETQRTVEVEIWSVLHQDAVKNEGKQFKEDDWKKKCSITQDPLLFELKDLEDKKIFEPKKFAAYGSKPQGIFFKCSAKWQIIYEEENDKEWLKFHITDDKKPIYEYNDYEYTTIQMRAETNTGDQIRDAKVSVVADIDEDGKYGKCDDEYEIPLTVTQEGFEFDVIVDEKLFSNSFGALNGTYETQSIPVTAKITKGAENQIKIDYDKPENNWVGYEFGDPYDDENNDNLTLVPIILTPVDNPTKGVRNAILSIGNEVSPEIKTLPTITQDGYKFGGLINTPKTHTFEALAEANKNAEELDLECTPGAKWIVKSKPDWVQVRDENDISIEQNKESQSINSTKIKIYSVKDNLNTASDQSYEVVTIKSVLGIYEKELKVKRKPYEWNVDYVTDEFIFNPVNNKEQKINIKSSGGWTSSVTDAVVFATATEDHKSGYVTVSVDDNYTDKERTNTITINSNQYDSEDVYGKLLTEDVTITQKKYVYDVKKLDNYKDNNGNIPFSADEGSKDIKGLSCSGDLVVADDGGKDWMRVVFKQGTLIITVDANKETEERSAEIIIQSEHYESSDTHRKNYQTKFKVTQAGATKPEEEK